MKKFLTSNPKIFFWLNHDGIFRNQKLDLPIIVSSLNTIHFCSHKISCVFYCYTVTDCFSWSVTCLFSFYYLSSIQRKAMCISLQVSEQRCVGGEDIENIQFSKLFFDVERDYEGNTSQSLNKFYSL